MCRMLQQRVGQLERRHRMVAGRRWLELVRGTSAECQHLEEFGTVQLIRIDTEGGTGRVFRIVLYQAGEKYLRESQRTADAELPTVDCRTVARNPFAGLPFVGTAHADAECLSSSEYIPFGNAEDGARTCLVIALGGHVQFQLAIQRKVVNGVDLQVQRIATAGGIFGNILHFRIAENAETGEAGLGLFLLLLRIEVAGTEFQPVVQHFRTDAQLPFVKDGHIFIPDGICRRFVVVAVQEDRYARDAVRCGAIPALWRYGAPLFRDS